MGKRVLLARPGHDERTEWVKEAKVNSRGCSISSKRRRPSTLYYRSVGVGHWYFLGLTAYRRRDEVEL